MGTELSTESFADATELLVRGKRRDAIESLATVLLSAVAAIGVGVVAGPAAGVAAAPLANAAAKGLVGRLAERLVNQTEAMLEAGRQYDSDVAQRRELQASLKDAVEASLQGLQYAFAALGDEQREQFLQSTQLQDDYFQRTVLVMHRTVATREGQDESLRLLCELLARGAVQEHPRVAFDRTAYVSEHCAFTAVIEPRVTDASLPEGIVVALDSDATLTQSPSQQAQATLFDLGNLPAGELAVLIGDGGAGKSTALKLLRAETLRAAHESSLTVLISLATYVPGSLDRAIHQELGVDHGTWRSLPDRMLLLCDALNECPSAHLASFMDELRPLLRRRRIACVLSTRGSTRQAKVTLPQPPSVCMKLEELTPIGIRRIAEERLGGVAAPGFVTAYRSVADSSGSSLLWTPFAVQTALDLWRPNGSLPTTLGGMLEAQLKARCVRDSEGSDFNLGPDVILLLAGAVAFQCLVVDGRLECPALEAGKCVRKAKEHCVDALGIVDMTERQLVELLARHELLQVSAHGNLSFGHQLLAGALAAPLLARAWRDHLPCLGEPAADDAWVLAARMVVPAQAEEFLGIVLDVDLMLGARAAREMSGEHAKVAEELLERAIAPGSPETVFVRGLFALAHLGSPGAVARLRRFVTEANHPTEHTARCALAATGNPSYLRELLPEVDRMRSGGIKVSGGVVSIWDAAPFPRRLDLARERLVTCSPGEPVGASLSLLAYERDPNDAALAEKHLRAAGSLPAWQSGLYALHETSPQRAREFLEEALSGTATAGDKAALMHAASLVGMAIDVRSAFDCAVAETSQPSRETDSDEYHLGELISKVIAKSTLPRDLVGIVERELSTSTDQRRKRLWQLATGCSSITIADHAVSCIERWGEDLGYACNYFLGQPELARTRRQRLMELCERGFDREQDWYTWQTWRALALVGHFGFTPKITKRLSAMIQRLVRVQRAADSGATSSLSPGDALVLGERPPEHARYHLGSLAAQLIPSAAQARADIDDDVLLSLLYIDTGHNSVTGELREALAGLSDAAIDGVLSEIPERWTRLSALVAVCPRGSTSVRLDLLAQELKQNYNHLAALHLVQKAIDACWCSEICEMVLTTVADIPVWSEHDTQFFWDFVRAIARRLGPDDQAAIRSRIDAARTPFARRVLELWREHTLEDRVGLSRLSPSRPNGESTA